MKIIKRVIMFMLVAVCLLASGCTPSEEGVINVYVPDGAPALAIVQPMKEVGELDGKKVKYTVVDPSTISGYLTNGSADFAIVPTNVAANVYNKNIGYKLAAAVTHGNLYIVGKEAISGETMSERLSLLKNKKVGIIGQAGTPNMLFKYIMNNYDITHNIYESEDKMSADEVATRYYSDGALAMQALATGQVDYALFGEPAVSAALKNVANCQIIFDLCDIWQDITEGATRLYPQAVLVARANLSRELIDAFVENMKAGESFAEENPQEALTVIASNMKAGTETTIRELNEDTVIRCNIQIIKSTEAKEAVDFYLSAIYEIDQSAVGGKLPDEDFYF